MTDRDELIYSSRGRFTEAGMEYLTWREVVEQQDREISRLRRYETMISDLDRNENGRHECDVDSGDPTGTSQGNPHIRPGDVFAYSISGSRRAYRLPERVDLGKPEAWEVDLTAIDA